MVKNLLADTVDIRRWLEADAEQAYEDRVARDREIGRGLTSADEVERVLSWWGRVAPETDTTSTGTRVAVLARLASVLLVVGGVALGLGLGSLAFAYDGQHPVNVLALLGVLVGVPFILLLFTLVFLLPGTLPGFSVVRETISVINPGRWIGAWLNRFAGLDLFGGFSIASGGFARWQLTVFSQWLAVGYFAGVLIAGVVLVTVTDLAFGWSSTLTLDAESVHRLFRAISLPWQSWFPGAVPDTALIETSRYYRLESAAVDADQAAALGAWWPFVLMTILIWGLAPRLTLLLASRWRLRTSVRSMLCQNPEVLALLDRMTLPRVDFGPELLEEGVVEEEASSPPPAMDWDDRTGLIIWNEALDADLARTWLHSNMGTAGGPALDLSVRSADRMVEQLAHLPADLPKVVIFCKGWEPPLLEFGDFLDRLRSHVGDQSTLVVVPMNTGRDGVDERDREIWADFLGRHADRRLYVLQATTTAEVTP